MFLFIRVPRRKHIEFCVIQIHPMFLFISDICLFASLFQHSNTSYVLIHLADTLDIIFFKIFKYILCSYSSETRSVYDLVYGTFKYILCSYSSTAVVMKLHTAKKFKYILCSYSSLVINGEVAPSEKFKYILCSYSSYGIRKVVQLLFQFKYILCSYSSKLGWIKKEFIP